MSEFATEKLMLFPDKLEALKRSHAGDIDTSYPVSVELSLTDACNFSCVWCSDAALREKQKGSMKKKPLFELIDDLARGGTRGVTIEGGGEPTLHSLLGETISRVAQAGMSAGLITNGSCFNYRNHLDHLEWIRVSLDAANHSQMDILKEPGQFDSVMSNIREIAHAKTRTILGISYIVTKKSRQGLEKIIPQLRDAGVDYVQVKPVVDHPNLAQEKDDSIGEVKKFERDGFKVFLGALDENILTGNAGVPCVANSLTTVITASGDVYLCGRINVDPSWPALGNINHQSFRSIWLGEDRKRQSELMRDPYACKSHCPECRLTKFNIAVEKIVKRGHLLAVPGQVQTPNFI